MKRLALVLVILSVATMASADPFGKVSKPSTNFLSESKTQAVGLDAKLQPVRGRPMDTLRISAGAPTQARYIGLEAQAEWTKRWTARVPVSTSLGVGYLMETRTTAQGSNRNFHQLPVYLTAGYTSRLVGPVDFYVQAGPALRQIFERGYTPEQGKDLSYLDGLLQAGADYRWSEKFTSASRSVGVRFARYFGFADRSEAPAQDSLLASFAFDL